MPENKNKKTILDVLTDEKKVEEIAKLPTEEDVKRKLGEMGVDATSKDVSELGNIFEKVSEQGEALAQIGGGFTKEQKIKAAKITGLITAAAVVIGWGGYEGHKHNWWRRFRIT